MGQRHPDRADRAIDVAGDDLPERRMHRRLGDAVHIDQPRRIRVGRQPRPKTLRLQRFPAEHHGLEFELPAQLGLQRISGLQRIERRRGLTQDT